MIIRPEWKKICGTSIQEMKMLGGCRLMTVRMERLSVMTKITERGDDERIIV